MIQASINNFEINLTNKEVKELKNFSDNLIKYHEQISFEVMRELQQIQLINHSIQQFERDYSRLQQNLVSDDEDEEEQKQFFFKQ